MTRKFAIRTFGCQMNEHDSERLAGLLIADGLEPTNDVEEADVVVLNTCCIRENADNKLYGHLGHLKALQASKPGMQIAVGGCLAQKDRELVRTKAAHVDVVFGTNNLARAPELLRRAAVEGPIVEILDAPDPEIGDGEPGALSAVREVPYAAWVTIQTGCNNSCAFCIVPSVRGKEVSRRPEAVIAEVRALARRGVVEVTLLGQNVNSYGRDLTRRRPLFADLLRSVSDVEGIERVRFTSPHPKDLRTETIEAMAGSPAVCEQLHLPVQSGSDRVLAAMRRGYTADRYLGLLAAARRAIPDLAVTTDLIVGFPGETERDFDATLALVAEAGYDSAYTFIFSPRPGTRAAGMVDEIVPPDITADRFERLRTVVERSALDKHRQRVGRSEEVLVEGPSRRNPEMVTGRTRQGKLAHFSPPPHGLREGSFAEVSINGGAPHHLIATFDHAVAPARWRRTIPVRETPPPD